MVPTCTWDHAWNCGSDVADTSTVFGTSKTTRRTHKLRPARKAPRFGQRKTAKQDTVTRTESLCTGKLCGHREGSGDGFSMLRKKRVQGKLVEQLREKRLQSQKQYLSGIFARGVTC